MENKNIKPNSSCSYNNWCERLFGKYLIKCSALSSNNDEFQLIETFGDESTLPHTQIIGIYYSFANINQSNDEFRKKLQILYEKLNSTAISDKTTSSSSSSSAGGHSDTKSTTKQFEVVQVVLWANNDVFSDFEKSHRQSLLALPWYAIPFSEIDLKTKLSRKFRIKSGVPTLVLLDRDGSTVSISAQDKLIEDPLGAGFPWRPRPVDQVLKDVALAGGGQNQYYAQLPDGIRGFYFSANWCPPCRAFTPQLAAAYQVIRKKEPTFEIIFVSSDRSAESYNASIEAMPWLSVPWQQSGVRAELAQLYGIRGIPTLLLLDRNGHVITMDGRAELAEDPMAQNFPWKPRPVNFLTERFANKLHDYPAIVLFVDGEEETEVQFAESVLSPAADEYYKKYNINFNVANLDDLSSIVVGGGSSNYYCCDDHFLHFLIGMDSETSDILRDLIGLDDVVPLLVAIDIPNRRFAVMEYGVEITVSSVCEFVERFQKSQLKFVDINERAVVPAEEEDDERQ